MSLRSAGPLGSESPYILLDIFMRKVNPMVACLVVDFDTLQNGLDIAVQRGMATFEIDDTVLALCFAIGALMSGDHLAWVAQEWSTAAHGKLSAAGTKDKCIPYFVSRILQVEFLQITGQLREAWIFLSSAVFEAQHLGIPLDFEGNDPIIDKFNPRVRALWIAMWIAQMSLTSQLGLANRVSKLHSKRPLFELPWLMTPGRTMGIDHQPHYRADFLTAWVDLINHTKEVVKVQVELRLRVPSCPFNWVKGLDLSNFTETNNKMCRWRQHLPKDLEWQDHPANFSMDTNWAVHEMNVLLHLQYASLQLRHHRTLLVVAMRLSSLCDCEAQHALFLWDTLGQNFEAIRLSTLQCVTAAKFIIQALGGASGTGLSYNLLEMSSSERIDLVYSAGLVLVAARGIPFVLQEAGALSILTEQIEQAKGMMAYCQNFYGNHPVFSRRIGRARALLEIVIHISAVYMAQGMRSVVSDANVMAPRSLWAKIYGRLWLRFPPTGNPGLVAGQRMTFCWVQSLPVDFD